MGLNEDIKELESRIDEVAKMNEVERKAYIDTLRTSFAQIQKAIYPIISEEGAILIRFKYSKTMYLRNLTTNDIIGIIHNFSKNFALSYGFDESKVFGLLESKNLYESSLTFAEPNSARTNDVWVLTDR